MEFGAEEDEKKIKRGVEECGAEEDKIENRKHHISKIKYREEDEVY